MIAISLRTLLWVLVLSLVVPFVVIDLLSSAGEYATMDSRIHALIGIFAVIFSAIAYKAFQSNLEDEHFLTFVKLASSDVPDEAHGQFLFKIKKIGVCYFQGRMNYHFRINDVVSRVLIFILFLGLGFHVFSQREINVLTQVSKFNSKERYCKIEEKKKTASEVRPECRLIFRAFELGYAKDLGTCGEEQDEAPKPCDLKYEDEPFFHYAYRKTNLAAKQIKALFIESSPNNIRALVERDVKRFDPMVKERIASLNNEPRSLHLIISNLPPPETGILQRMARELKPSSCINEYRRLPNKSPQIKARAQLGSVFHFTSGHLLFDTAYETTVASCGEYNFTWEVLPEVCEALIKNPEEQLVKLKLMGKVEKLLARVDRRKITNPQQKTPLIREVSSIQCLSFGEFRNELVTKDFNFKGQALSIVWKKIAIPSLTSETPLRVFRETANAFNPGFRYSQLTSKQSLNLSSELSVTEDLFADAGFMLTKLGYLRDSDIFIGSVWLLQRSDLLELYPYYLHLNNFVESFRQRYKENYRRL